MLHIMIFMIWMAVVARLMMMVMLMIDDDDDGDVHVYIMMVSRIICVRHINFKFYITYS